MWPAYATGLLLIELGRPGEAAAVARDYLRRKDAWLVGDDADDWINLARVEYLAGAMTREEFASKREVWLRSEAKRSDVIYARAYRWLKAYAFAVRTPADATEALTALEAFGPPPPSSTRTPDQDDGIGYTYLLAGRAEEAIPYLSRAARSCMAIDWPIEQTWANLHLGEAEEARGNRETACGAYATVVARWGGMPSVSADRARARRKLLRCQ
jgi:serine/threonine-protein kinase